MSTMRSDKVIEVLPFRQFSHQINIILAGHQLIELLLNRPVGSLYLAIELGCSCLDVDVTDAKVFNVPMELGLELMPPICPYLLNPERELLNDMIDEVNRTLLCVPLVYLQSTDVCRIIDSGILISFDLLAIFSFEDQELDVHLYVMAGHLFLISPGMNLSSADVIWQAADAVSLQNPINCCIRYPEVMIPGHVPHDPHRAEVVLFSQTQDLFNNLIWRSIWM